MVLVSRHHRDLRPWIEIDVEQSIVRHEPSNPIKRRKLELFSSTPRRHLLPTYTLRSVCAFQVAPARQPLVILPFVKLKFGSKNQSQAPQSSCNRYTKRKIVNSNHFLGLNRLVSWTAIFKESENDRTETSSKAS